jgi:uncharacterized protein YcgL (UPF0745 family)
MIPLTMLCSWQRSMIVRYITNARYLYLGRSEDFGTVNAQVFFMFTSMVLTSLLYVWLWNRHAHYYW